MSTNSGDPKIFHDKVAATFSSTPEQHSSCDIARHRSAHDCNQYDELSEQGYTSLPRRYQKSDALYPCSTKTREVLGNPSPPPNFPRPKRFPEGEARGKSRGSREIREIFRGRGFCTPRPEGFPEGEARGKSRGSRGAKPTAEENLEGGGDGFPNTSLVLVEHRYIHFRMKTRKYFVWV